MHTRLLFTALFGLILSACGARETLAPPRTPTAAPNATPDWRRDWLRGEPCAPPCIMGITPGTLSQTETVTLLHEMLPATLVEVKRKPDVSQGAIDWLAAPADPESVISALFYQKPLKLYDVPLNTVIAIRLGDMGVLPLNEVLAAYGEPSHVLALAQPSTPGRTVFIVVFVYVSHGFSLTMDFEYDGEQPILETNMNVNRIHFFPPTMAGFEGAFGIFVPVPAISTLLVPWRGFVEFADYCRELPSPTEPARRGCP